MLNSVRGHVAVRKSSLQVVQVIIANNRVEMEGEKEETFSHDETIVSGENEKIIIAFFRHFCSYFLHSNTHSLFALTHRKREKTSSRKEQK